LYNVDKRAEYVGSPIPGTNGKYNTAVNDNMYFYEGAISKKFKLNTCWGCWDAGVGLMSYNAPSTIRDTYDRPLSLAGYLPITNLYWLQRVGPVFALKINDQHSIGLSIDCNILTVKIQGFEFFDNAFSTVSPGSFTDRGHETKVTVMPTIGWLWQANESLSFGAYFRPKRSFKFKKYKGFYPKHGTAQEPNEMGAGVHYTVTPKLGVGVEAELINFKSTDLKNPLLFPDGTIRTFGSAEGAALGWKDAYIISGGGSYLPTDAIVLTAAYVYRTQRVRRSQTLFNSTVNRLVQNIVAFGISYNFCAANSISFFYTHGFKDKLTGTNAIPTALGGGNVNLQASHNNYGITLGHKF